MILVTAMMNLLECVVKIAIVMPPIKTGAKSKTMFQTSSIFSQREAGFVPFHHGFESRILSQVMITFFFSFTSQLCDPLHSDIKSLYFKMQPGVTLVSNDMISIFLAATTAQYQCWLNRVSDK